MAAGRPYLAGPESLRAERERRTFWFCILATPVTLGIAASFFGSFGASQIVLLLVGALVFVSFARGRLLGGSVRLGAGQLPEIHRIVHDLATRLGIETPHVFVRDDAFSAIGAVGTSEPYSLILSSQYLEYLSEPEMRFLIARELAHIAAGHTRIGSLLSASGRENPAVALVFGAWLRKTEYTADRVALALAPSLDDAMRAIAISTFHAVGRRVDLLRLVEQQRDLDAEPALRLGEWSSSMPYATRRFLALGAFSQSPLFAIWRERFENGEGARRTEEATETVAVRAGDRIEREQAAPIGARLGAIAIDALAVAAIANAEHLGRSTVVSVQADRGDPGFVQWIAGHAGLIRFSVDSSLAVALFFIYCACFVAFAGQTLGMMVMDVRVVTTTYGRPNVGQIVWRYVAAVGTATIGWAIVGFWLRVHPHDMLSRTRVIRTRTAPHVVKPEP